MQYALQAAEVLLDNVAVPGEALLDGGYDELHDVVDEATLAISAEAVGIMQVMHDKTVEYSKSRDGHICVLQPRTIVSSISNRANRA